MGYWGAFPLAMQRGVMKSANVGATIPDNDAWTEIDIITTRGLLYSVQFLIYDRVGSQDMIPRLTIDGEVMHPHDNAEDFDTRYGLNDASRPLQLNRYETDKYCCITWSFPMGVRVLNTIKLEAMLWAGLGYPDGLIYCHVMYEEDPI